MAVIHHGAEKHGFRPDFFSFSLFRFIIIKTYDDLTYLFGRGENIRIYDFGFYIPNFIWRL